MITLANRQRHVRFDGRWLRRFAAGALPRCVAECADDLRQLGSLAELEISVVSDRTIARVHLEFMHIPGATDVITFGHGELVMSAQTAAVCAREHGHPVEAELALYTVHGMLHLNGWKDGTRRDAGRMHRVQDRVWRACLAALPPPCTPNAPSSPSP